MGGGLNFPQEHGGPYPVNGDAQRTPEVALQKGDFRYNLRDDTQKRRIARGDTNRTVGVVTDTADTKIALHQKPYVTMM